MKRGFRHRLKTYKEVGTKIAERGFVKLGTREERIARRLFSEEHAYFEKIRNRIPEIVDLYYVEKLAFKKVAKKIGVDHKTLRGWMNLFGLPRIPARERRLRLSKKLFFPSIEKREEYRRVGRRIARRGGVRLGSEEERIMREIMADKTTYMEKIRSLAPRIVNLYYVKGLSAEEVAERLKITTPALGLYMEYLGLPMKPVPPGIEEPPKSRRKRKLTKEEKEVRRIEIDKRNIFVAQWFPRYREAFEKDKIIRDAVEQLRVGIDPDELVSRMREEYKINGKKALDKVKMAVKIVIYNIDGSQATSA